MVLLRVPAIIALTKVVARVPMCTYGLERHDGGVAKIVGADRFPAKLVVDYYPERFDVQRARDSNSVVSVDFVVPIIVYIIVIFTVTAPSQRRAA